MNTFEDLLTEVNGREILNEGFRFYQYKALCKITYNKNDKELKLGAEKIAEALRAVPGATRVSTASLDREQGHGIFNVRLISQKSPKEALISFKKNCLKKFPNIILKVEVGAGSIEVKNFVK